MVSLCLQVYKNGIPHQDLLKASVLLTGDFSIFGEMLSTCDIHEASAIQ